MKKDMKLTAVFYITLLIFSLLIGITYSATVVDTLLIGTDFLESFKIISINNLLMEVGILSISFLLSFIIIGNLIFLIYFLIKTFTIGFLISTFVSLYSFSGIAISILYLLTQVFIIFILYFFINEIIKNSLVFINYLVFKKNIDTSIIFKSIKKVILILLLIISHNLLIYTVQNTIINFFKIIVL